MAASVSFDLRGVMVVLADGRSLSPSSAAARGSRDPLPVERVTLTGGQRWQGLLRYEAPPTGLDPFTMQPGTLEVNGSGVQLPPIAFFLGEWHGGG